VQFIFIYGQLASGKLTVARELAARTGVALFHNHLVVDAVGSVFSLRHRRVYPPARTVLDGRVR
jgi:hypothetical protein